MNQVRPVHRVLLAAGWLLSLAGCSGGEPTPPGRTVPDAVALPADLQRPAGRVPVAELPAGFVYRSDTGAKRFMLAPGPAVVDAPGVAPGIAPTVFMPLGLNYAWPALSNTALEYELTLPLLARNGVNLLRVWHCTWGFNLGGWNAAGRLDGPGVAALDRLFAAAEKRGVKILLVYDNHTDVLSNQARHGLFIKTPAANGVAAQPPVCMTIADYFQAPAARVIHAARVKAILARWGNSPAFFGLEMFNELDLALPIDAANLGNRTILADWAHFMAGVVWAERARKNVAAWHPIGVSTAWPASLRCVFDRSFDFVPVHQYIPEATAIRYNREMNETQLVAEACLYLDAARPLWPGSLAHRPWLMEYGFASGGSTSVRNKDDPSGAHLRHALWASLAAGGDGCAMPWWWDSYLLPGGLTQLYKPLSDTVAGLPWEEPERAYLVQGEASPAVNGGEPGNAGGGCRVYGTLWTERALLYLVRGNATWGVQTRLAAEPGRAVVDLRGVAIDVGPFEAGRYAVEWVDPATGRPAGANEVVEHTGGRLKLNTPAFTDDLVVVVHRQAAP